jgi:hypothetical protein
MPVLSMTLRHPNVYFHAGASALLLLGLTAIHHAYGAFAYGTPWRLHVVYFAAPVAIAIVAALWIASSRRDLPLGILAARLAAAAILILPVAGIGFYEGGYNHVLKNLVFFAFGRTDAVAMFPPPTYEMPNDLFFEVTGVAQFPLSILTAIRTLALLREARRSTTTTTP